MEIAFHDNPEDAKWILANMEPIGIALTKGLLKYFGVPFIQENVPLKQIYRVQVGAYSIKSNVEKMLVRVKAAGFTDAFIKAE